MISHVQMHWRRKLSFLNFKLNNSKNILINNNLNCKIKIICDFKIKKMRSKFQNYGKQKNTISNVREIKNKFYDIEQKYVLDKQILFKNFIDFILTFASLKQEYCFKILQLFFLLLRSYMTNLYVCKGGLLIPRDPEKPTLSKPTVITYKHTIRQINENICNCKQEKQKLIKQYESQLNEKDNQILALVNRIADKETEIEKYQSEVLSLKNSHKNTPAVKQEQIFQAQECIWDRMQKTLNSTVVSCFSLGDLSSNSLTDRSHQNEVQKTERQMDQCFKKTNILMSEIQGIMKKKRKYQFHNPIKVENSIIEELQNSQEKSQEQIQQLQIEDTFCLPRSEDNDYDSLDMTTFQSVQNFGEQDQDEAFYGKLLRDSVQLKNAIVQMKEQSMQQIREVEAYYQKQLKISYEELEKQRNKNSLIELTKNKLNELTDKGRQALAELDQNEGFGWEVGEKRHFHSQQLNIEQDENFIT